MILFLHLFFLALSLSFACYLLGTHNDLVLIENSSDSWKQTIMIKRSAIKSLAFIFFFNHSMLNLMFCIHFQFRLAYGTRVGLQLCTVFRTLYQLLRAKQKKKKVNVVLSVAPLFPSFVHFGGGGGRRPWSQHRSIPPHRSTGEPQRQSSQATCKRAWGAGATLCYT